MPSTFSQQLRTAFEQLTHGVSLENAKGDLLYVNPAGRRMFQTLCDRRLEGMPLEDAMREHIHKLLPDVSDQELNELVDLAIASRGDRFSQDLPEENGRHVRLSQAKLESGHVITVTTDIHDLMVQKRELETAREEADAADRAKSQFLSAMSHEMRTPLNGVLGMAQVLANRDLPEEMSEIVETLLESSRKLSGLMNDVLDASIIHQGDVDIVPTYGDIRSFFEELVDAHRSRADSKNLWIKLILPPNLPGRVKFDAIRLRQCLEHLVSNALKFTDEGGIAIVVTCSPSRDKSSDHTLFDIHIQDTGIGIHSNNLDRVFKAFAQEQFGPDRAYEGAGLGLTLTRHLIERMDGSVKVASQQGSGSVLTLTVEFEATEPKYNYEIDSRRARNKIHRIVEDELGASALHLQGKRVLVVDDSAANRSIVRLLLGPTGASVVETASLREAFAKVEGVQIGAIIADGLLLNASGQDSSETIRLLRRTWPDAALVLLTADSMDDAERDALDIDGFLQSPIEEQSLIAVLAHAMALHSEHLLVEYPEAS